MAMPALTELTETMQMYVKTIHEIQRRKGAARVTDIASALGVQKGSVSVALRTLADRGFVNYAPYDITTLTEAGLAIAEELERRYGALNDFFVSVLGIDATKADEEACSLEHRISPELYERLVGFIDYYQNCTGSKFRWDPEAGGFCVDPDDEP